MTVSKVRADYEQLAHIASVFGQQCESAQLLLNNMQNCMDTLQAGDWVGQGAESFYAEMNSAVLPAMQRVVVAMYEAANVTTKIRRIMKDAEEDSARLFRIEDSGEASPTTGSAAVSTFVGDGDEASNGASGGGASGDAQPLDGRNRRPGKVVRVEHPQKKNRRKPPGPGAYTEAEYQEWLKRHPNAKRDWVPATNGKRTQDKAYTPEELWWKGYYYAKTVVEESWTYEVWLSDDGKGAVLEIYVKVD